MRKIITPSMKVLLIEPNYKKSKNDRGEEFPPLGLMKLSTFHKLRRDKVEFFKGTPLEFQSFFGKKRWSRIYISTDFTFQYNKTLEAINLALKHAKKNNIYLGGVGATLLKKLYKDTEINVVKGLLDKKNKINIQGENKIEKLIPDYSILEGNGHKYQTNNAYIGYATRGCKNKCPFCAVPIHEPVFHDYYINLKRYVNNIKKEYGEKKDLILMDNNVLASKKFEDIINDIKELGFERGATFSYISEKGRNISKYRYVDFNQGLDARFLNEKKAKLLSEIAIRPARIAFDHLKDKKIYIKAIELMAKNGVKHLSNYLLFNFKDKPEDLYKRIKINIQLNERLGTCIYSFPMKYIPLSNTDRRYIGDYWSQKQLRAIQVILNATHGVVGPKRGYVMRAFGKSIDEFNTILWMPENYIMYRGDYEKNEAEQWLYEYLSLSEEERKNLKKILWHDTIDVNLLKQKGSSNIRKIIKHYELLLKRVKRKAKINFNQKYIFEYQ